MTRISVYDDTEKKIEHICERLDWSEAELIDYLFDNLVDEAEEELGIKEE